MARHRRHGRPLARLLAMLVAMALVAACSVSRPASSDAVDVSASPSASEAIAPLPSPSPTSAPTPSPASTAAAVDEFVASADGMTLTVDVDKLSVAPGDVVTFTATLRNDGAQEMDYTVPWCGGGAGMTVSVALPVEPMGKTWAGIAQVFKDYALTEGYGPGGVPALQPVSTHVPAVPCGDGQSEAMLAPGASVTSSMPWTAVIVAGVGALPGPVEFTVNAGYDRQNGPPSRAPEATGPIGSWFPIYKQLVVTGTIDVAGSAPRPIGAGEAIDGLLADKTFAKWLKEQPSDTWSNANLFLISWPRAEGIMPKGPAWEIDLFREIDVPRNWAIAFIDPFDASVISVTYCNDPCDR